MRLKFLAARPPARVLEIGCGQGDFLKQARRFSTAVQGFEYSRKALDICRENGLNVVLGSAEAFDEPLDIILAFQVLEHLENPGKVLKEWIKRIAPGGYLVVAVPNQDGALGQGARQLFELAAAPRLLVGRAVAALHRRTVPAGNNPLPS